MSLFKKKHVHAGKALGSKVISHYTHAARHPHRWTTEVRAVCDECKTPFIVEFDGEFQEDDFKDATIRK